MLFSYCSKCSNLNQLGTYCIIIGDFLLSSTLSTLHRVYTNQIWSVLENTTFIFLFCSHSLKRNNNTNCTSLLLYIFFIEWKGLVWFNNITEFLLCIRDKWTYHLKKLNNELTKYYFVMQPKIGLKSRYFSRFIILSNIIILTHENSYNSLLQQKNMIASEQQKDQESWTDDWSN